MRRRCVSVSHGVMMSIDPPEIPPATPGTPTEPPREDPPGNPRPEIPPPMQDPGPKPQPQELPGRTPDEAPVRGPEGPRTPYPATDAGISDLPGSEPDVLPGSLPSGTI
jgi:hypothetical protein